MANALIIIDTSNCASTSLPPHPLLTRPHPKPHGVRLIKEPASSRRTEVDFLESPHVCLTIVGSYTPILGKPCDSGLGTSRCFALLLRCLSALSCFSLLLLCSVLLPLCLGSGPNLSSLPSPSCNFRQCCPGGT